MIVSGVAVLQVMQQLRDDRVLYYTAAILSAITNLSPGLLLPLAELTLEDAAVCPVEGIPTPLVGIAVKTRTFHWLTEKKILYLFLLPGVF